MATKGIDEATKVTAGMLAEAYRMVTEHHILINISLLQRAGSSRYLTAAVRCCLFPLLL